jgi:hypothetical protein
MGGLAGLVRSVAIGSVPLVIASCAAVFGAGLAPAVADWSSATAAVEASHRQNQTPSREEAPRPNQGVSRTPGQRAGHRREAISGASVKPA